MRLLKLELEQIASISNRQSGGTSSDSRGSTVTIAQWPSGSPIVDLLAFFAERLKVHLRDKGARHDLIDAVFSLGGQDDLALIVKRVEALTEFLKTDDGANLLGRRQARAEHPLHRGEEGQDELRRRPTMSRS